MSSLNTFKNLIIEKNLITKDLIFKNKAVYFGLVFMFLLRVI